MSTANQIINENRDFWDNKVTKIYTNIELLLSKFINKVKTGIIIDLKTKEIKVDKAQRCCIVCFGGYAYETYKKIFQLDTNININFPSTIDYDISISLKRRHIG